jgi:putative nucleotidyltransferase with HDIG domain
MSAWKFPFCPQPPDWRLDWTAIRGAIEILGTLDGVPQDPTWHAEGDVLIHTGMVAEALAADQEWRALDELDRNIVFAAALLHDIGKAPTTRLEEGRIRSPRHSVVGQRLTRQLLWNGLAGGPEFAVRERIAAMVRLHGLPLMFIERPAPERAVIEASMSLRCDHLALLAKADVLGRLCPDTREFLDRIAMFKELCAEQECLSRPKEFASDHHRFIYFNANSDFSYVPYDDTRCEATLMSGLLATGKSHWITKHAADLPLVSLDDLRIEMDIDPGENQGAVINAAKEQAKGYLRQGQSFVWNATNITKDLRKQLIALFANYKARVRIVYTECPPDELRRRNRRRTEPVPAAVIDRMIEKLEVPAITEAHGLVVAA